MEDAPKAVWSIPYVFVAFFPSLKQNFIAYRSSKVSSHPDCIFEIHPRWQSGFSRVYSNCCCSCSFEPEIIIIRQSSLKLYSNNIKTFQISMTFLNACTKNLETYWMHHVQLQTWNVLLVRIPLPMQFWISWKRNFKQSRDITVIDDARSGRRKTSIFD